MTKMSCNLTGRGGKLYRLFDDSVQKSQVLDVVECFTDRAELFPETILHRRLSRHGIHQIGQRGRRRAAARGSEAHHLLDQIHTIESAAHEGVFVEEHRSDHESEAIPVSRQLVLLKLLDERRGHGLPEIPGAERSPDRPRDASAQRASHDGQRGADRHRDLARVHGAEQRQRVAGHSVAVLPVVHAFQNHLQAEQAVEKEHVCRDLFG